MGIYKESNFCVGDVRMQKEGNTHIGCNPIMYI